MLKRPPERAEKSVAADTDEACYGRQRNSSPALTADDDVFLSLSSESHAHNRRSMLLVKGVRTVPWGIRTHFESSPV